MRVIVNHILVAGQWQPAGQQSAVGRTGPGTASAAAVPRVNPLLPPSSTPLVLPVAFAALTPEVFQTTAP